MHTKEVKVHVFSGLCTEIALICTERTVEEAEIPQQHRSKVVLLSNSVTIYKKGWKSTKRFKVRDSFSTTQSERKKPSAHKRG